MLTAVVTAVATTVTLGALELTRRRVLALAAAWRQRREPDHLAIHAEPWPLLLPPECWTSDARLVVACAPSRSLGPTALTPAAAAEFGRQQLGFGGEVVHSSVDDGVRLEPAPASGAGIRDHAWVCTNGKLQVSITIPIAIDSSTGRRTLAVRDLLEPLARIATAAASAEFRGLHGLPARAARMKTDWRVGVSMYSRAADGTSLPSWQDLVFPGSLPSRLVADRQPFCPPVGYATGKLQNWPLNRSVAGLLQTFLSSFLADNGYDRYEAAVLDAVAATRSA